MQNNSKITIFFAGDFCSKPSTAPIKVSEELTDLIRSCDLKLVNFEVPLKPEGMKPKAGRFYQSDDAPAFLENLGFDLFPLANNHVFDYGLKGYEKTFASFQNTPFGSGTYEEAYKIKIVEVKGTKVGFLALSFAARFGVFNDVTSHEGYGSAYINDLQVNHIIIRTKKEVDYLIVLPHDGIEYVDIPTPETIARYRDFVDYGADAVIGTHPHCPQGWETYKGKPIFYSLGNFLFNSKQNYSYRAWNRPHWYEGLCVILNIEEGSITYKTINTRNVDNLGIVVDNEPARNEHNRQLCHYLVDKKEYDECFEKQVKRIMIEEVVPIIDSSLHKYTVKQSTKALLGYWKKKVLGKPLKTDEPVQRTLKHDSMRQALLRTLEMDNNKLVVCNPRKEKQ
ncbi:MAG: CapA family protein [Prevotella sp.]|nr:CapA family protein [Prevotella sp.]